MLSAHRQFLHDEAGATAIEYSLIAALIALVILAAMTAVATRTVAMWTTVATHV